MFSPRTTRGNRIGLTLAGLAMVLGGVFCLGQTQSAFFAHSADRALLTAPESHFARDNAWFWVVVAVAAGIVALMCLRWLAVQLRQQRVKTFRLEPERTHGGTRLAAGLLTDAVEDEIGSYSGVQRVRARLTGAARRPDLRLDVGLDPHAEIAEVRSRIETEALPRLRQALELDELPVRITLRLETNRQRIRAS